MTRTRSANALRRRLALSTALGLSLGALAAPTSAQETNTPTLPTVQSGTVTFADASLGGVPVPLLPVAVTGASTKLNVNVATAKAIVNWNTFDIATGSTVAFTNSSAGNAAILNRVSSGDVSQIAGTMSGPNTLTIYLINTNGILFGNGAAINVGGLVASTLNLTDDNDFLTGNTLHLQGVGNTAAIGMIDTTGPATITTNNGVLALIAPQIALNANTNSGTGATVYGLATDVNLTTSPGGPLSITINAGTTLAAQSIKGAIVGDRVYALVTPQAAVNALLDMSGATVTNATAAPGGVVVLANDAGAVNFASGDVVTGLNVLGTAASVSLGAINFLNLAPTLNGSILVNADGGTIGGIAKGGSITATSIAGPNVASLNASGGDPLTAGVTVSGALNLGSIAFTGQNIHLGAGAAAVTSTSLSDIVLNATAGTVTIDPGVTLTGDTAGQAGRVFQVGGAGTTGLTLTGSTLIANPAATAGLQFTTAATGNDFLIGNVQARGLTGAIGGTATAGVITRTGNVAFGNLTLTGAGANQIDASGSTDALDLQAISTAGPLTLNGGTGGVSFTSFGGAGNKTVTSGAGITGTSIDGAGTVSLTADAGSPITISGTLGTAGTRLGALTVDGSSNFTIGTSGVSTGTIAYLTSASIGQTAGAPTGQFNAYGDIDHSGAFSVKASSGGITLHDVISGGTLTLQGSGIGFNALSGNGNKSLTSTTLIGGNSIDGTGTVTLTAATTSPITIGGTLGNATTRLGALTVNGANVFTIGTPVVSTGTIAYLTSASIGETGGGGAATGAIVARAGIDHSLGFTSVTTGATNLQDVASGGALNVTAGVSGAGFGAMTGAGSKTVNTTGSIAATSIRGAGAVSLTGSVGGGNVVQVGGGIGAAAAPVASLAVNGGDATLGALYVTGAANLGQGAGLRSLSATGVVNAATLLANTSGAQTFSGTVTTTGRTALSAGGLVTTDAVIAGTDTNAADRSLTISGSSASLGVLTAGSSIQASTDAGFNFPTTLAVAGANAGTSVTLTSSHSGSTIISGNVTAAGGDYNASGGYLHLTGGTQQATGAVTLAATDPKTGYAFSGILVEPGVTVISNTDNVGAELLTVGGPNTGDLTLTGSTLKAGGNGTGEVRFITQTNGDFGALFQIGDVIAGTLSQQIGNDAATIGPINRTVTDGGMFNPGKQPVSFGNLTLAGSNTIASDYQLQVGTVQLVGGGTKALTLTGDYGVTTGALTQAAGTTGAVTINAQGGAGAGEAQVTSSNLGGALLVSAGTGGAILGSLAGSGTKTVNSAGLIGGSGAGGAGFSTTGTGAVDLEAATGGTITIDSISATGGAAASLTLNGGSQITINGAANVTGATRIGQAGDGAATTALTIGGALSTGSLTSTVTTGATSFQAVTATTGNISATSTGGGAIDFGAVNGPATLATSSTGTTTFNGVVGAMTGPTLTTLTTTGPVMINGGSVTTSGQQSYGGVVTLGADTTLKGSNAVLAAGIDGTASNRNLTLTFAGPAATTIGGVGATAVTNVGNLTVNGAGSTTLAGGITTTGSQSYTAAVTLSANATLASTGNAAIGFATLTGGGFGLTVNTGGATTFGTGATGFSTITTDAGGTTSVTGTMGSTGAQTYGDNLLLAGDTVFTAGAGAIGFGGTITGAHALTTTTSGTTTFGGAVGAVDGGGAPDAAVSPTSVTSNGAGQVNINGGSITTSAAQAYTGAVSLGANTVLTGTQGTFTGGVQGNGHDLTLNFSNTTAINGGSFTGVGNFTTGGGGNTTLSGAITTAGGQTYNDNVQLTGTTTLQSGPGGAGPGAITFNGTLDGNQTLSIKTAGTTTFQGVVGGTAPGLGQLTVNGTGAVAINGGAVTTTAGQSYAGATTLGADTLLTSGSASTIGFGSTITAPTRTLSVRTGAAGPFNGTVNFGGAVAVNALALRANTVTSAAGNAVGTLAAAIGGGFAFDNGAALTIGTVDGLSGVTAGGALSLAAATALLTLNQAVSGAGVTLTGSGIIQAAAAAVNGGTGAVTLDGNDGAITLGGALTTTNTGANAVRLIDAGAVQLGAITTGAGGTVTLGLTGGDNLSGNVTQAAGTIITAGTLAGTIGGSATLTNANAVGTLGAIAANGLSYRSANALTVVGPVNAGTGNLSLQTNAGALALAGNLVATPTGTVTLTSAATITQTAGAITAGTLTGSSVGGATLNQATNSVGALVGFTNTGAGGFTLTDAAPLTVTATVDAGTGALAITAPSLTFTGQTLMAGGNVTLATTNGVTGGTITGAAITINDGATATIASATGSSLSITAPTINLTTGSVTGAATLNASGNLTIGTSLSAGTGASALANGTATVASIASTNGTVQVRGASASVTSATATNGALDLRSTAGALSLGNGSAGTTAVLNAVGATAAGVNSGTLGVSGTLTTGATATLTSTGTQTLGTINAAGGQTLTTTALGDINFTALTGAGAKTLVSIAGIGGGAITGAGAVALTGATTSAITIATVGAVGAGVASLTINGGNPVTIGASGSTATNLVVTGNIAIGQTGGGGAATGALTINGAATSGGTFTSTTTGATAVQAIDSTGALALTTGNGGVLGFTALTGGGTKALVSGAGITGTSIDGASAVALTAATGSPVTIGTIGTTTAVGSLTINGGNAVTIGTSGNTATTLVVTGNTAIGQAAATGALTVNGAISSGGTFTSTTTGAATLLAVNSAGTLALTTGAGGALSFTDLTGTGAKTLISGGSLSGATINGASAVALTAASNSPLTISGAIGGTTAVNGLTVNGGSADTFGTSGVTTVAINSTAAVTIGATTAPGSLTINGAVIAPSFSSRAAGPANLGDVNSPGAFSVTTTGTNGDITFGTLSGNGAKTLSASGGIAGNSVLGTGAVSLTAGAGKALTVSNVIGTSATRAASLVVNGGGQVTIGTNPTAQTIFTSGDVAIGQTIAAGALTINGAANAGGAFAATAAGFNDLDQVTAGTTLAATSTGGAVAFDRLVAPGATLVSAGTSITGNGIDGGGALRLIAATASPVAIGTIGAATAAASLTVSGGGSVTFGASGAAGTTVNIAGPTRIGQAADGAATGALTVNGNVVDGGAFTSTTAGATTFGNVTAAGALGVTTGSGDASFVNLLGAGAKTLTSGRGIAGTSIQGAGAVALTAAAASPITIGAIGATGAPVSALTINGGNQVTLGASGSTTTNITVAGATSIGQTNAVGALTVNGPLSTGSLISTSTGASQFGAITANNGDIGVTAGGAASIAGAVTGAGAYRVRGASVALGAGVTQAAAGLVDISATAGAIAGGAGLTLQSNSDGAGAEYLALDATGGGVAFGGATLLGGTAGQRSDVGVIAGTGPVVLGVVTARSLGGFNAARTVLGTLTTAGDITDGSAITLQRTVALTSTGGQIGLASLTVTDPGQGVTLTTTAPGGGAITATTLSAPGAIVVDARGAASVTTVTGGSGSIRGTTATLTTGTFTDALTMTSTAGKLTLGSGTTGGAATLSAAGDVEVTTKLAAGGATGVTATGNAALTQVSTTGGALSVNAGGAIGGLGTTRANLAATGNGGNVTVQSGGAALLGPVVASDSGGTATITAGTSLDVSSLVAGGAIATTSAAATTLGTVQSKGGAIAVTGQSATVGSADAAGALTLKATGGALALTTGKAGGSATLTATGTLNSATLTSTGAATLTATGAATLGQTTSNAGIAVTAASITAGQTNAGAALGLTSTGALSLTGGQAGGDASFDAGGMASLGAVTAGATAGITVKALDVAITGAQKAARVTFINRAPTTQSIKLGDGLTGTGYALGAAEVNQVQAGQLTIDGGSGNVEVGALAFNAAAGSTRVDVLATGRIDVTGAVSGSGAGRTFRFGGSTTASDEASVIRVVATSDAGGRLLFDTADLDLRGNRIGVGQAAGFLDPIGFGTATGLTPSQVGADYVGNPNSSLYNSTFGGALYGAATPNLITARTLTVRYTAYALFQNTASPGLNAGVALGTTGGSGAQLVLQGPGSTANDFGLFGSINGISGSATAVLGSGTIVVNGVDLANSRVNGCLIGSGAGCLSSVVSQPLLNVFDRSRVDVFRSADDFAVPFDPVVGTNNEALFSGFGLLDAGVGATECAADTTSPDCEQKKEQGK